MFDYLSFQKDLHMMWSHAFYIICQKLHYTGCVFYYAYMKSIETSHQRIIFYLKHACVWGNGVRGVNFFHHICIMTKRYKFIKNIYMKYIILKMCYLLSHFRTLGKKESDILKPSIFNKQLLFYLFRTH